MPIPDKRLIKLLQAFLAASLLLAIIRVAGFNIAWLTALWWSGLILLMLAAVSDYVISRKKLAVSCYRIISTSFALGAESKVRLFFENPLLRSIDIQVVDHCPDYVVTESFPLNISLPPQQETSLKYEVLPVKRGEAVFGRVGLRVQSFFKLWRFNIQRGESQAIKIYPNFMAISNLNFLVYEQQLNHIGAHTVQRRGLGSDFKQLREYQRGDELRQMDWKASARQHKLISREYQDERDQDIVFLLDSGRRMRASESHLSHFDHCVNAMLLTSYIALMAGDAVGFMSFAGTDRWLAPVKGKTNINQLLNSLYDLHSTSQASDLLKAAENLMLRHRKRSLIIIVTNIRDEDSADVIQAVKLLSKKHLVLVACLREAVYDQIELTDKADFDSTLTFVGVRLYLQQRNRLLQSLRASGVIVADATANEMHIKLVNEYMALKRAGRI